MTMNTPADTSNQPGAVVANFVILVILVGFANTASGQEAETLIVHWRFGFHMWYVAPSRDI